MLRLSHLGVLRKNGFLATEVYHLWHREQLRNLESVNRQKVLERSATDMVLAEKGLREIGWNTSVTVTTLH